MMNRKSIQLGFFFAALAMTAAAQTVTGSGSTNTVPVFTGSSMVGNSPISVSGNNVGIGTTGLSSILTVNGDIASESSIFRFVSGTNTSLSYIQMYDGNAGMNFFTPYGQGNSGQGYFNFTTAGNSTPALRILSNNNVGIGTTTPSQLLEVNGNAQIDGTLTAGGFNVVPTLNGNPATAGTIVLGNNTGTLGNANFNQGSYQIIIQASSYTNAFNGQGANGVSVAGGNIAAAPGIGSADIHGGPVSITGGSATGVSGATAVGGSVAIQGGLANGGATNIIGAISLQALGGNVGIGTVTPGAALEVNGSVKLTAGSGASVTFADGTVQSTAYTGVICGGDYAESVDVSGDSKHYEPGDVLVISSDSSDEKGDVAKSSKPYSTAVVGIYSTKPGIVGRRQTGPKDPKEVPMAMIGIVPTKVIAENGAIHRGDLLVSSSSIGYAMKGTDRSRLTGAVIGKALGNLDNGEGVIEVVVTLQ